MPNCPSARPQLQDAAVAGCRRVQTAGLDQCQGQIEVSLNGLWIELGGAPQAIDGLVVPVLIGKQHPEATEGLGIRWRQLHRAAEALGGRAALSLFDQLQCPPELANGL